MRELQALIFDLDGVITDTEPLHAEAEHLACLDFGFEVPRSEWHAFKGLTDAAIFRKAVAEYAGRDIPIADLIERKLVHYFRLTSERLPLVPGVVEFIRLARPKFAKIGLATSSLAPVQRAIFDAYRLHDYFDAVVTAEDVMHGKPHPEPYLLAAKRLKIEPAACLVIEDSDNGIRSALAAGCRAAGITTTFPRERLLELSANPVVDTYPELAQRLGL
ncbi:MAG: HAD family phosphatase [Patescibacteria group bacterium]|jgi:beta-phosphoglucomutase